MVASNATSVVSSRALRINHRLPARSPIPCDLDRPAPHPPRIIAPDARSSPSLPIDACSVRNPLLVRVVNDTADKMTGTMSVPTTVASAAPEPDTGQDRVDNPDHQAPLIPATNEAGPATIGVGLGS